MRKPSERDKRDRAGNTDEGSRPNGDPQARYTPRGQERDSNLGANHEAMAPVKKADPVDSGFDQTRRAALKHKQRRRNGRRQHHNRPTQGPYKKSSAHVNQSDREPASVQHPTAKKPRGRRQDRERRAGRPTRWTSRPTTAQIVKVATAAFIAAAALLKWLSS